MLNVIGWDIGGANVKAAFIKVDRGIVKELKTAIEYFPIWRVGKEKLPEVLKQLTKRTANTTKLNAVGVTMTAELSDAYWSKREGVNHILNCVEQVFPNIQVFVLDCDMNLRTVRSAKRNYLKVAAANWPATGWMVAQQIRNCLVIDSGSTTTSIIPVIEGKIAATGKTDLEKLINGELVYTGALRTNVAAITHSIPIRGGLARVSSELFALSGDVHLILENITEKEYTTETADGRGKSKLEAMARLARVVCADIEMLREEEIIEMARYIYEKQIEQLVMAIKQVHERIKHFIKEEIPAVTAGLGRSFLARKAAEKAGFKRVMDLGEIIGASASLSAPSVGVALIVASKLEGKVVRWKRL